jgi:tetraacyldisaccharide 4'-kinase
MNARADQAMSAGSVTALERAWYAAPRWTLLLLPLEGLFALVTALRRAAYGRGLLRRYRAACPVVVVGNLSVGGTGKTPVVQTLARALVARGLRPGIVSRGYGGTASAAARRVSVGDDPRAVGDEPLLHAASGAAVAVGRDRAAAARLLEAEVDLLLADDGLQHYALQRDMEIVTLDAERGFGNGHLLPVGPLRESPQRLRGVDWVLERNGRDPATAFRLQPRALRNLLTGEERSLAEHGLPAEIDAVAGIGDPQQFFRTLRGLGFRPIEHAFPDHHVYTAAEVRGLEAATVVMTEKDAVKWRRHASERHWELLAEAELPAGLLDAVASLVPQRQGDEGSP